MNLAVPPALRRFAAIPAEFVEESFGSWLARLAAAHFTTREELVRAILAECGSHHVMLGEPDFNSQPPAGLIDALSVRTSRTVSDLQSLLIPAASPTLRGGVEQSATYCPLCWREDFAGDTRFIRKQWCERWTILCEVHEVPLCASRFPIERLLCAHLRNAGWIGEAPPSMYPASLRTKLVRMQRHLRALESGGAMSGEDLARSRVLRDLAIFAGTRFETGSLIDWSFDLEASETRRLSWIDPSARAPCSAGHSEPRGTLEVRQLALRLSTLILDRMYEQRALERAEDIAVVAALNSLPSGSDMTRASESMLRAWPDEYQALWEAAFGWPGQGGAEYFASRYRPEFLPM